MHLRLLFALRTISRGFKFVENNFTSFSVKQLSRTPYTNTGSASTLYLNANLQQNGYGEKNRNKKNCCGIYTVHLLIGS